MDAVFKVMESWEPPRFPVNGHDLLAAGCPKGRMMSAVTAKLRELWKESDFLAEKGIRPCRVNTNTN